MANHKPSEPSPADFRETAHAGQEAGIADETAAYDTASEGKDKPTPTEESSGHPS